MYKETEFKNYLDIEKDSALATIKAYLADVKEFDLYVQSFSFNILACSSEIVKRFLLKLKDEGKSGSTINRKMVSIRKYYEFLRSIGEIEKNPCTKLAVPKVENKEFEYLSIEQIEKLLAEPGEDSKGIRDKALLELMYACGLKVSEVTELNIQDVDLRIGFVSCRGDRTKSRIIPIGHHAKEALLRYMKDVRAELIADQRDTGALFVNYAGQRISRQGIWKIVKLYGKKSGISEDLSPQLIRNSFAAHMILNGADLKSLQELLGNEDVATTKLFLALSKVRVMDVYDKTHPRA